MQERVELVGGKISIQSEPERGTQIEINLELYDD
jgi:signal transduction histidine kinase